MGRKKRRSLTIQGFQVTPNRGGWRVTKDGLSFSLLEVRRGIFRLSYESSAGRVRRQFQASNLESAIGEADAALAGKRATANDLTVATVFRRWVDTLTCGSGTRKDYLGSTRRFIVWLGCRIQWKDLRLEILQSYVRHLVEEGKSARTIALYTLPIRAASLWAAANWPEYFRDFAKGYRPPNVEAVRPIRQYFTIPEVAEFLLWLREQEDGWKILPGVALQGLCGLRVLEVLRLTWDRVDLERRLVSIEGKVKNMWSIRTLPIPELVAEILREAPEGSRVVPTYSERTTYSAMVAAALRKWRPGKKVEPRGLRRTLPSEAKLAGWDGFALERYLGHAPRDVTERHYVTLSEDQILEMLAWQVASSVDCVLEPYLAAWKGTEERVLKVHFGN